MRDFVYFQDASELLASILGIMSEIDSNYGTFHKTDETFKSIRRKAKSMLSVDQQTMIQQIMYWCKVNKKQFSRVLSLLSDYCEVARSESDLVGRYDLKEFRKQRNLTQQQLAEMLGTTQKHISDLESGRKWPSKSFVVKFSAIFNTHTVWPPATAWFADIANKSKSEEEKDDCNRSH